MLTAPVYIVRKMLMRSSVPLRKIAQPTDVARAAAFLASHRAAGHISGQCISVDGGMYVKYMRREHVR
jgi:NAD(P)-dependent dehydrogenase (short-subunit alcohol dehydrogenase family)